MRRFYALLAAAALVGGCATTKSYLAPQVRDNPVPALPSGEIAHRIFLTGNTGDGQPEAVLRALAADARAAGEDATVVILGDVTAHGLPEENDPDRAAAQAPVDALIAALSGLEADVVVVPGDRDWEQGEDGVKRLEDLLDDAFDTDILTPGDQSGGPREDKLAEGLRLIALDTAWWLLNDDEQPDGEAEDQDIRSSSDVARVFEQIVVDRADDRIVVVAHHPLISRGSYAGYRGDPFTGLVSRTIGTSAQDLSSPRYRQLRAGLGPIAAMHDRLVWAAGHDRILQTYNDVISTLLQQTHLVSGTGGGSVSVAGAGGAQSVASLPGYQRLVYFKDGRLWQETVELDPATGASMVAFRVEIAGENAELVDTMVPTSVAASDLPSNLGGTVTTAADADFVSDRFKNSGFTRAVFGENYRDVWKTEVEFPVLDLGTEAGGLVPIKRGGGLQTISLRLQGADGYEYGLRLLEKSGLAQVPYALRDGLVGDIVLELRAAMSPYGSLVASPLARAAGIAQPDPKIFYVPDDPRLGRYREIFGGRLALFEIRPNDDMSAVAGFEGMDDVVSAANLREEMRLDQDHRVDQRAYLRARLFDMVLADWDRHSDQWRWAAFEPGDLDPTLTGEATTQGKVYVPIARDRDFSFYGIGGGLQPLLHAVDPRLQPIDEEYGSVKGLTTNGFYQDRRFLNELTLDAWREVAEDLRSALTDAAITQSIGALPDAIEAQVSDYWTRSLLGRRDGLVGAAETYYELIAGTVDVIGSDERELFEGVRLADGSLAVTVRSFKGGEAGRVLYQRTLHPDETHEVRMYGFSGRDVFRITGDGPRRITVRVIGGGGDDEVVAPGGDVAIYDTPEGMEITERGPRVEDRRTDEASINRYDPTEHVLGSTFTVPTLAYRVTDGVLLGATKIWNVPGFRLRPFAATHTLSALYGTATGAVAASYTGRMREAIDTYDLAVDLYGASPRYARNFYGLGNGTPNADGQLIQGDLALLSGRAGLGISLGEAFLLTVGPSIRYADATRDSLQTALGPIATLPSDAFDAQLHGGAYARLEASTTDDHINPRQGLHFVLEGTGFAGITGPADTYGKVGGDLAAYFPVRLVPQVTLALRAGGEHVIGDFPFFDAAVLGGDGSLRGYRRERFAGRSAASASAELRTKLIDVDAYVLPLEIGVLGFGDVGRVWSSDSPFPTATVTGDDLQLGFGGGLWVSVVDRALLNLTVGASDEHTLITLALGFGY